MSTALIGALLSGNGSPFTPLGISLKGFRVIDGEHPDL
jgi:hypothetical protein